MTVEAGSRMAFKEALKEELEESDLEYGTVNDNLMACKSFLHNNGTIFARKLKSKSFSLVIEPH